LKPSTPKGPRTESRPRSEDRSARQLEGVPLLARGADPGRVEPGPLAVRDRLHLDPGLLDRHGAGSLFAYEVTRADMKWLRGLAAPGDRVVFRRGGRPTGQRICAVRTPAGVVLSRVLIHGDAVVLLPAGEAPAEAPDAERLQARPGVIAGTHVLVLRR
jgi:hypothetical protein